MKYMRKLDTGWGEFVTVISKCKLLLSNVSVTALSTDVFCDEVLAGVPYRLTEAERIELFDPSLLPRIRVSEPYTSAVAAIVYGKVGDVYRFITDGTPSPTAYAAVAATLFYKGRITRGECVTLLSDAGAFTATVTDDGVLLFV